MRTIVILQRDARPPALIGDYLLEAGFALDVRRLDRDDPLPGGDELDRAAALVALGIDDGTDDPAAGTARSPRRLLARGTDARRGARRPQLVRAAGGDVFPRAELDLGWEPIEFAARDGFVHDVDPRPLVFSWRAHTCRLPDDALLLADSAAEPQIFRVGEAAWGVEFHPEVDKPLLRAGSTVRADRGAYTTAGSRACAR